MVGVDNNSNNNLTIDQLPNELLYAIFAQLSLPDLLLGCSLTCKHWRAIIDSDEFPLHLLSINCDVGRSNDAIRLAAARGRIATVERLLNETPSLLDPANYGEHEDTPLNLAAYYNHLDLVQFLVLEKGAHLENGWRNYSTPLLQAVKQGNLDVAQWLLVNGADVEASEWLWPDMMAIHFAAKIGHVELADLLLFIEPFLLETVTETEETPLNIAAQNGHLAMVEYLVGEKKADLENHNDWGMTPLLQATRSGHLDVMKCLLANGANLVAKDIGGNKAIHWAVKGGHEEIVKYMLTKRPSFLEAKNSTGSTPLNKAAQIGNLALVKYLGGEKRANLENKCFYADGKQMTPLLEAVWAGHVDVVEWLLANGADLKCKVNLTKKQRGKSSAIHIAAYRGHFDVVYCLLKWKPSLLELENGCGFTPLALSLQQKHVDVYRLLKSEGAMF